MQRELKMVLRKGSFSLAVSLFTQERHFQDTLPRNQRYNARRNNDRSFHQSRFPNIFPVSTHNSPKCHSSPIATTPQLFPPPPPQTHPTHPKIKSFISLSLKYPCPFSSFHSSPSSSASLAQSLPSTPSAAPVPYPSTVAVDPKTLSVHSTLYPTPENSTIMEFSLIAPSFSGLSEFKPASVQLIAGPLFAARGSLLTRMDS